MKQRFRLYRRKQGSRFYVQDGLTGKQVSLQTTDRTEAVRLVHARNEADHHPGVGIQIARAYLVASDAAIGKRTWQEVMDAIVKTKQGTTRQRWEHAIRQEAMGMLRPLRVLETRPEHFLEVLEAGTVATNVYLRRLHHFAIAMAWLPWPVLAKRQWPAIRYAAKRGITWAEHQAIVAAETNAERKTVYEMAWHVGVAQIDLAALQAEDVDWDGRVLGFTRQKTGSPAVLRFGDEVAAILKRLPASGPLFPKWSKMTSSDRACWFHRRCQAVGIKSVSLHSYRYAWAGRAKVAGYPERYAQEALGHKSKAVHHAYARGAVAVLPSLEDYEKRHGKNHVAPMAETAVAIPDAPLSRSDGMV